MVSALYLKALNGEAEGAALANCDLPYSAMTCVAMWDSAAEARRYRGAGTLHRDGPGHPAYPAVDETPLRWCSLYRPAYVPLFARSS